MCKDKLWEGVQDEMFETRVQYKHSCCKHLLPIYRLICFIFQIQTILHFLIYIRGDWYAQLAYMTIWGHILTSIAFGGMLCITPRKCREVHCHKSCYRFVHTVYNVALILGVLIFLIFWVALAPQLFSKGISAVGWWLQIELHFFTQMFILIDFILCDIFFFKWQLLIVIAVGVAYLIVNASVTLSAFRVYPIMTWKDSVTAIWVIVSIGIVVGAFFLFWWLGRKKQKRRMDKKGKQTTNLAIQETHIKREEEDEQAGKQNGNGHFN